MAITGELANIVVNTNYNDIPKEAIEDTNNPVIDFVGAAVAGNCQCLRASKRLLLPLLMNWACSEPLTLKVCSSVTRLRKLKSQDS